MHGPQNDTNLCKFVQMHKKSMNTAWSYCLKVIVRIKHIGGKKHCADKNYFNTLVVPYAYTALGFANRAASKMTATCAHA